MEHFDYVIVLCPSERKTSSNGKSRFFDEMNLDEPRGQELYLGGQIRMEAVADVAPYVGTFVVVGGSHKKVTDMKEFLIEEFEKELRTCRKTLPEGGFVSYHMGIQALTVYPYGNT